MTEPGAENKILLIDDDPDFVEATRTVLESVPYEVVVAYDGDEGLVKVQEERPDLVLLDIIMPTRDGFYVCEKLKSDPELWHIPVIMLTSLSQRISDTAYSVHDIHPTKSPWGIHRPLSP